MTRARCGSWVWKGPACFTAITVICAGLLLAGVRRIAADLRVARTIRLATDARELAWPAVEERFGDEDDRNWALAWIQRHAQERLTHGQAGTLYALFVAPVSARDLDAPGTPALAELRARVKERGEAARRGGRATATVEPVLGAERTASLVRALAEGGVGVRDAAAWQGDVRRGIAFWLAGLAAAAAAVAVSLAQRRAASRAAWLAMCCLIPLTATGLYLASIVTGPTTGRLVASAAGRHCFLGCAAGATALGAIMFLRARRVMLREWVTDGRAAMGLAALSLLALALFGSGPGGVRMSLYGAAPLEVAKLLLMIGVVQWIGRRWHAGGAAIYFIPAAVIVAFLPVSIVRLSDFGAVLVLLAALAFVAVALQAKWWVAPALGVGGWLFVRLILAVDWTHLSSKVALRLSMWHSPFDNAQLQGDQVARGLWAVAAGGLRGLGPFASRGAEIPAAPTDLALAYLCETHGSFAVIGYLALIGLIAGALLRVGTSIPQSRSELRFVPVGVAALLLGQAAVAAGGTVGLTPLSGVVVPFASVGGTAAVVFVGAVVLCAGLAHSPPEANGAPAALVFGTRLAMLAATAVGVLIVSRVIDVAALRRTEVLARPLVTTRRDGHLVTAHSGRLLRLAASLPRARIVDRHGVVMAEHRNGHREYVRGAAAASLLGVSGRGLTPLPGTIEASVARDFAVFRPVELPVAHLVCGRDAKRSVRIVAAGSAPTALEPGCTLVRLRAPDLMPLAVAAVLPEAERQQALNSLALKVEDAHLTIDADLQAQLYALVKEAVGRAGGTAGAGVVIEASSGEVVAEASAPAIEPATLETSFLASLEANAAYSPLRNFARYRLPPGSAFKPLVTIAALELGMSADTTFTCASDRRGPGRLIVDVPGASGVIHDHRHNLWPHGMIDMTRGLAVSCNVLHAQLAANIGPEALAQQAQLSGFTAVGTPGVGFPLALAGTGQGPVLATAHELARFYSAIAAGGTLRDCDVLVPRGRQGPVCTERQVMSHETSRFVANALREVVAGKGGTGGAARERVGAKFKVYGKTGTSEQARVPREGENARDHAWFCGFVELDNGARYSFAFLIARGGSGGKAAAWLAPRLGELLVQKKR